MKALTCTALALILLCNAAQARKLPEAHRLLFLKNHFAAGFAFPVTLATHESHTGLGDFNVRNLPGFTIQLNYNYNFTPYFGIGGGTHVGIKNFGYRAAATPEEFSFPKKVDKNYQVSIPFFSVPFYITPRFFIGKKGMLQADLGGSITLFLPGTRINVLNYYNGADVKRLFDMKFYYRDAPLFMVHAGLSYGIVLKSENIFKVTCAFDYGRAKAVRGYYTFYGDDLKVGYGKMYSTLSSVEVGISYVFTRAAGLQKG